jgi:hypothetical protein
VIPRDPALERHLVDIACRAAGHPTGDAGLSELADARALPMGIRPDIDALQEAREELADLRNYLVWGVTLIYPLVVAGEPEALDLYSMLMGALAGTVGTWHAMHRVPS